MNISDWFFQQTSQALGFLSMLGVVAAAVRWQTALRRDILLAFAIYLAGSAMREVVVYVYSFPDYWTPLAYTLSGVSRVIQLVGVVLFLHAALSEHCQPWVLWSLLGFVVLFVMVV
jgi:hypothetical protein